MVGEVMTKPADRALLAQVAERIGGVDRMVQWINENPENERSFWVSIYPKLLSCSATNRIRCKATSRSRGAPQQIRRGRG
jgi:hypothetical protein